MATGDTQDMAQRIKVLLPPRWFPWSPDGASTTPVLDAVLAGLGSAWAAMWSLLQFVRLQTRINTATGAFLDLVAFDFFGLHLARKANEGDAPFRIRIIASLFPPRDTRANLVKVLVALTGRVPLIFEPEYCFDTGGYGSTSNPAAGGGFPGYASGTPGNVPFTNANAPGGPGSGGYGCTKIPFQFFVVAYRPFVNDGANVGGYGTPSGFNGMPGGYSQGAAEYDNIEIGLVTDADIFAAIAECIPAATIAWTRISN